MSGEDEMEMPFTDDDGNEINVIFSACDGDTLASHTDPETSIHIDIIEITRNNIEITVSNEQMSKINEAIGDFLQSDIEEPYEEPDYDSDFGCCYDM